MLIAVAGPYSAPTSEGRQENLNAMNRAAVAVLRLGHIPVIGVNAALPVVAMLPKEEQYEAIMKISLALVATCDAILTIGSSPGADREVALMREKGLPVFESVESILPVSE